MKKLILPFFLFLFSAYYGNACSCNTGTRITFCYSISYNWNANYPIIIQCVKVGQGVHYDKYNYETNFMKVKVLQTLHGQNNSDTIVVFGDNSPRCLDYVSQFNINDTLILHIGNSDTSGIYICGRDYLKFSNGIVLGNINSEKTTSMPLDSFLNFIKSAPCRNTSVSEFSDFSKIINISPNPSTSGVFNLEFDFDLKRMEITVFNIYGQIIRSQTITSENNDPALIDLTQAPNGIYFVKITDGKNEMSTRIIKN